MQRFRLTRPADIALALIVTFLLPAIAYAQDVTEPALKAAFVYNLAKFTEWPPEAVALRPFSMCVLSDDAVGEALERIVKDRQLGGNAITVIKVTSLAVPRSCHILYISGFSTEQTMKVIASLRGAAVLTVSNLSGFIESGGIAQIFFENGRIRFRIGRESALRASLQVSAKILTLAVQK